jgi:hypothetical protein
MRTAEAHKWTTAALEQTLDDLKGLILPRKEDADEFLKGEEQRQRHHWMDDCQRMAQNASNLAFQDVRVSATHGGGPL